MRLLCLFLIFASTGLFGQPYKTIEPLEDSGESEFGIYYKDFNNVLDGYEGTYEFNGNGFDFKIVLKKIMSNCNNYFWTDMIVGKYQYIKDGVEVNYLSTDLNVTNDAGMRIKSNWIKNSQPLFCNNCLPQKWLTGAIFDPVRHKSSLLYIAKKTENGQEGIMVWLRLEAATKQPWESDEPIQLPLGKFFMRKL